MKYTVFCLIVIFSSVECFEVIDFIRNFSDSTDTNITRVRTTGERDRRWKEFVVLDFIGLVEQYDGYTAEEYDVQTNDGYILKLHRISGSPSSPRTPGKPVVFLAPGITASSDVYTLFGPQRSITFNLADVGYDVWIGNFRGNTYSRRHVQYSTASNSKQFWEFSLDEIALIDLPLFIDTALEKTNEKKLTYIGNSMGTTLSYILLSSKPEYNDVMNLVVNISPVAFFTQPLSNLLSSFTQFAPLVMGFLFDQKIYQVLPQSKFNQIIGRNICTDPVGLKTCQFVMTALADANGINSTLFPTILAHYPAGASAFTINHYYQMMLSGKFRRYDFGATINKKKYHDVTPPEYNLTKISSPQAIFYSIGDSFNSKQSIEALTQKLQNLIALEEVSKNFNHGDFIIHHEAKSLVYDRLLAIIEQNLKP